MKLFDKIRIGKLFVQLVRNPQRTELIFEGVEIASKYPDNEALQHVENLALSNKEFRQMQDTGYMPEVPSMENLARCEPGTFGAALYKHMRDNNLDFTLFPRGGDTSGIRYFTARLYQDHDLWHALLGLSVGLEDELALQAFGIAQFDSPIALLLVIGGLLRLIIKNPIHAVATFQHVVKFYELGKQTKFLLGVKLHELFGQPLPDVRMVCGV